jgi:hypothetical protein
MDLKKKHYKAPPPPYFHRKTPLQLFYIGPAVSLTTTTTKRKRKKNIPTPPPHVTSRHVTSRKSGNVLAVFELSLVVFFLQRYEWEESSMFRWLRNF